MIDAVVYDGSGVTTTDLDAARDAPGTVWVRATDSSGDEFQQVAETFDIHPLAIEDVRQNVRPKTEEYPRYTFVLLKTAALTREETSFREAIRSERIGVFIGDNWVITLSAHSVQSVDRVWHAIDHGEQQRRLLGQGPDFIAYRLIDSIVDEYFDVLDQIETRIETVEENVVASTDATTLDTITDIRRELLSFRKLAWPAREAIGVLARGDPDQVQPATEKYYRDVYDHLVQLVELTETYRDLVGGARDIYLNTVSQSTNDVMKTLTVVATIVLPLTLVAGIYGMNFQTMPELGWTFGYPAVLLGMLSMALVLVMYFKQQRYI